MMNINYFTKIYKCLASAEHSIVCSDHAMDPFNLSEEGSRS